MNVLKVLGLGVIAGVIGLASVDANALTLRLTDKGTGDTTTVVDGGLGDADGAADGTIVFAGGLGGTSTFTTTLNLVFAQDETGLSLLTVTNLTTSGSGVLEIAASETGFSGGIAAPAKSSLSFGLNGTLISKAVTGEAYFDTSDTLFGTADQIGSTLSFAAGPFDGTTLDWAVLKASFSMTQILTIDHSAGFGLTSFDATVGASAVAPVPLPAGLALLLSGLGGLALVGRRRMAAAA